MLGSLQKAYLHNQREKAFRKQEWKELAEVCRKLAGLEPDNFQVLHDLIVAMRSQHDYAEADKWCDKVLACAPKTAPEHQLALEGGRYMRHLVVCGELLLRRGELDRARSLLLPLKKAGTSFHKKHFLLSEIYEKKGDLAQAAAEMEEMQRVFGEAGIGQWDHLILVRCRQLLPAALQRRDADAVLIAFKAILQVSQKSDLDRYIQARAGDPQLRLEHLCLTALAALARGKPGEAEAAARALDWPELADRILALALKSQGRLDECAQALSRLPPRSPLHLDAVRELRAHLFHLPVFLRDYAECCLHAGLLEEAYEACQALTTHTACELKDFERLKELRLLLLDRSIREDELRLEGAANGSKPDALELTCRGEALQVPVSAAFRLASGGARPDLSEVRFRLAGNYLRRGVRHEKAVAMLQDLSREVPAMRARALCQSALHFVRKGDAQAAHTAIQSFLEASSSEQEEERKRMLLDLGDSCEAAGLVEQAKICYGHIQAIDISYADIRERITALESRKPERPAPSAEADAAKGRIRERFTDLKAVGRGGMGVVYKAHDPIYGRTVALKVLADRYRDDEAAVARFLREGQAMARLLRHPGIVRVFEVGAGRDLYLAMEFVQGVSLRALLKEKGRLELSRTLDVGGQVCEALGFAHQSGIIHRDVKPDNVLMTEAGKVKLADFGLANVSMATQVTQVGAVMGTGQYMSPEQIRGETTDARSDIYSLGATLFELAAGRPPFDQGDLAYRHVNEAPAPPSRVQPGLPAAFDAVVLKCLEKDPAKRFRTCAELAAALREAA